MKTITLNVNTNDTGKSFNRIFNRCVGAGRAKEGLRADWQEQLKIAVSECGFEYIRFHGLFADDMCVCKLENGEMRYNWQEIDALFDAMLDIGIRPFVELSFMPSELASGDETVFWWKGNVTPPKEYSQWGDLVSNAVKHWIDRYGLDEVLQWYFEVWNEPNLPPFWTGGKKAYFKLYEVSARAIKAIDSNLRVGGPATSNFVPDERFDSNKEDRSKHVTHKIEDLDSLEWKGVWIEDFLAYCEANELPVDFVSTHPYPTDFALDEHNVVSGRTRYRDSLHDDLTWLKNAIDNSTYKEAEVHLTEWSSSPSSRDCSHDFLPVASYIVKSNIDCHELTNSLSYWVFTDIFEEGGSGPRCFHGGFGMMTIQGIKKPSFHAYRFLNSLGDSILDKGDSYLITKNSEGKAQGIFYNYANELTATVPIVPYPNYGKAADIQKMGQQMTVKCQISGLEPGAIFDTECLDADHGTAVNTWLEMGGPSSPTREETMQLKSIGERTAKTTVQADEQGNLVMDMVLEPWAVMLISER